MTEQYDPYATGEVHEAITIESLLAEYQTIRSTIDELKKAQQSCEDQIKNMARTMQVQDATNGTWRVRTTTQNSVIDIPKLMTKYPQAVNEIVTTTLKVNAAEVTKLMKLGLAVQAELDGIVMVNEVTEIVKETRKR